MKATGRVPSKAGPGEDTSNLPPLHALISALVGIGMLFAAPAASEPHIEDTLLFASAEAMDRGEFRLHQGPPLDLLATGTDFQLRRQGEDPRFAASALRVPARVLRDREADVLPPAELACRHRAYRYRLLIGPSYRADMWAALEAEPALSAAELARRTYGSFATAWHVKRDFALLHSNPASHP